MTLAGTLLPWGADYSTSWIALLVINVTTSTHDGLNSYPKVKYCTGAFVGGSWFLTSVSCLEPLPEPHQVTVMTGWGEFACSQRALWEFESVGLAIEMHPGYIERSYVDLAMVRTRRTVFHVPKAKLMKKSAHLKPDSKCRLISFAEKHPQQLIDDSLMAGFVSVKPAECLGEDQEGKICTEIENAAGGRAAMQICPGKLGALLECDGALAGVLTQPQITSTVCDIDGRLQIFEDMAKHQKWIQNTIDEAYDLIGGEGPPKGWKDMDDETFTALLEEDALWTNSQKEYHDYEIEQASADKQELEKIAKVITNSDLYDENKMIFSPNLNLYISTIVLCAFLLTAVIYFCHVQLHRFDHHLSI